jgi:mRNA interferase RelE/StbE
LRWTIEFDHRALRDLQQLDRVVQRRIVDYLTQRVAPAGNPRTLGEALTSTFAGLWRYRVGDYRVICRIEDERLVVLVVRIGHRRDVYDR